LFIEAVLVESFEDLEFISTVNTSYLPKCRVSSITSKEYVQGKSRPNSLWSPLMRYGSPNGRIHACTRAEAMPNHHVNRGTAALVGHWFRCGWISMVVKVYQIHLPKNSCDFGVWVSTSSFASIPISTSIPFDLHC